MNRFELSQAKQGQYTKASGASSKATDQRPLKSTMNSSDIPKCGSCQHLPPHLPQAGAGGWVYRLQPAARYVTCKVGDGQWQACATGGGSMASVGPTQPQQVTHGCKWEVPCPTAATHGVAAGVDGLVEACGGNGVPCVRLVGYLLRTASHHDLRLQPHDTAGVVRYSMVWHSTPQHTLSTVEGPSTCIATSAEQRRGGGKQSKAQHSKVRPRITAGRARGTRGVNQSVAACA